LKVLEGGGQPLFWHGLKLRTSPDLQLAKRGKVLKPLVIQRFQISQILDFKGYKSRGQQRLLREGLHVIFPNK
jgi:hypothetical protein